MLGRAGCSDVSTVPGAVVISTVTYHVPRVTLSGSGIIDSSLCEHICTKIAAV